MRGTTETVQVEAGRRDVRRRLRERRHELRLSGASTLVRLGELLQLGSFIRLDFPPTQDHAPRYGHGRPSHGRLAEIIGGRLDVYREVLDGLTEYADDLRRIPLRAQAGSPGPEWRNGWMPGLDAAALYGFLRRRQPALYLEIGSGSSTRFASRAREDGALPTRIVSIDPKPRAEIDRLCDHVHRSGLEQVDLEVFDELVPGDVVFFDGSHRVFTNSDVTVFFLDVLPRIPSGVLIGIHDIYLPEDYPAEIATDFYSEQYLLATWLLANPGSLETVLPAWFVSRVDETAAGLDELWTRVGVPGIERHGVAFWFEKAV